MENHPLQRQSNLPGCLPGSSATSRSREGGAGVFFAPFYGFSMGFPLFFSKFFFARRVGGLEMKISKHSGGF